MYYWERWIEVNKDNLKEINQNGQETLKTNYEQFGDCIKTCMETVKKGSQTKIYETSSLVENKVIEEK